MQCVPFPTFLLHMFFCLQEMLSGPTSWLGQGYWREVRLAKADGRSVAIKTLRDTQEETRRNRERHRWEAVALDAVSISSLEFFVRSSYIVV